MNIKPVFRFIILFVTMICMFSCISSTPISTPTFVPMSTATLTKEPTETPIPTRTKTFTPEPSMTATLFPFSGAFMSPPLRENEMCNEYTIVPQKGWAYYPTDFEPVAYVRVFVRDEVFLSPVVVELGLFVKAEDLKMIGGKATLLYDGQYPFGAYSAVQFQDAPQEIQKKSDSGVLIALIEVVDLENNPLPYIPNEESLKMINYVVDDYMPHPVLDIALPCPGFVDGHPINYASMQK